MTVRHFGSTSGYTELGAPAVAGNNSLKLPTGNGSAGQSMLTDGSGNLSFGSSIVSGTSQASTSGTSIDFTGIPSWAKRVTVMFSGVSLNGASHLLIQIGSTSFTTSGYLSYSVYAGASNQAGTVSASTGFIIFAGTASNVAYGALALFNISGNNWVSNHSLGMFQTPTVYALNGGGSGSLSGTLDRVRITTVNGTDTFDAGTINLLWE